MSKYLVISLESLMANIAGDILMLFLSDVMAKGIPLDKHADKLYRFL